MKKGTALGLGVLIGYLFAPYIKKGVNWAKKGLIDLRDKFKEAAAKDEEVPEPEEEPEKQEQKE